MYTPRRSHQILKIPLNHIAKSRDIRPLSTPPHVADQPRFLTEADNSHRSRMLPSSSFVLLSVAVAALARVAHPGQNGYVTPTRAGYKWHEVDITHGDQHRNHADTTTSHRPAGVAANAPLNCFPAIGFTMPSSVPSSLDNWWCDYSTEYAFVGFSYEITACQSLSQLRREFADIRNTFNGRYVRLYGFCDRSGFYNDVIDAAWRAGLGVHALIWFGWDGSSKWKTRRDALFSILHSNPKAPFVTRTIQFGSEPLYDWAIDPYDLAAQVKSAKSNLASLRIPVTVSEMAYGYQIHANDGGPAVIDAIDFIDAHMLPFFSVKASTASKSWPIVQADLDWFINNGKGKKIYLSENGWPSVTYDGVEPNSPDAVANVQNERDYYTLLDSQCAYFKTVPGGGVGWFAHIYSDDQEPGYGIYNSNGALKFPFKPRTSC